MVKIKAIKFDTKEQAIKWNEHNSQLVGVTNLGIIHEITEGYVITLAPYRWKDLELDKPLELIDGEVLFNESVLMTSDTFKSLYLAEQKQENIAYMSATNYISINYSDSIDKTAFLNEKSKQFGVLNSVILAKRRAIHATLNE